MDRKRKRILFLVLVILAIIFVIDQITLHSKLNSYSSAMKSVAQPKSFDHLLKSNPKLSYKFTMKKNDCPVSAYFYDVHKYGIIIFRKKIKNKSVFNEIKFYNKEKNAKKGEVYSGIIFDELKFKFKDNVLKSLNIFINKFEEKYITKKNNKLIYLSFRNFNTFSIEFNGNIDFQIEQSLPFSKTKELNELAMILKNKYIYFIYLKSFNNNNKETKILKKILDLKCI